VGLEPATLQTQDTDLPQSHHAQTLVVYFRICV